MHDGENSGKSHGSNRAFFCLGSNIDAEANLPGAAAMLARFGRVAATSSVWQTRAVGDESQSDFLNAAVVIETSLSAEELRRSAIPAIEGKLGRVRDPFNRNAARTIDVDLALYNDAVIEIDGSPIPDPAILTRTFVAVPLAEVEPEFVHPVDGRRLIEIAGSLDQSGMIHRTDVTLPVNQRPPPPAAPTGPKFSRNNAEGGFTLRAEIWLPRPVDEVFAFFSDAHQLETLTPKWLKFEVLTPRPIDLREGALIDYKLRVHGLPLRWRSRITDWAPPRQFVDEQVRGPYRRWRHLHTFEERRGGTLVGDKVDYDVFGGRLMNRLFIERDLKTIFRHRHEQLVEQFRQPQRLLVPA